jgi:hypothetical protein
MKLTCCCPGSSRIRHSWFYAHRRVYALGCSTIYVGLYLLAALCLATGVFHPAGTYQGHHHHGSHEDHPAGARHATAWPDICDFALQTLTTIAWHNDQIMPWTLVLSEILTPATHTCGLSVCIALLRIRAPPGSSPHLVSLRSHPSVHA